MRADTCLCGQATQQDVVIVHDFHRMRSKAEPAAPMALPCQREGYTTVAVFRILTQQAVLGTFSLHLRDDRQLPPNDLRLLETLGSISASRWKTSGCRPRPRSWPWWKSATSSHRGCTTASRRA